LLESYQSFHTRYNHPNKLRGRLNKGVKAM
jgi:hypothetical protein